MARGPAGLRGLPGGVDGPVEAKVIWAGGQLLHWMGGLSTWRMSLGRLVEQVKREEVFGLDFKWALAQ
jgi:hypothetical protein